MNLRIVHASPVNAISFTPLYCINFQGLGEIHYQYCNEMKHLVQVLLHILPYFDKNIHCKSVQILQIMT